MLVRILSAPVGSMPRSTIENRRARSSRLAEVSVGHGLPLACAHHDLLNELLLVPALRLHLNRFVFVARAPGECMGSAGTCISTAASQLCITHKLQSSSKIHVAGNAAQ